MEIKAQVLDLIRKRVRGEQALGADIHLP
jgi:hypothetical protein